MADVRLDFVPPNIPDLKYLHIYESPTKTGTFAPIEQVSAIGTYPNYISYYTTELAGAADHWFAIEWEDSKGAKFGLSQPIQGGVETALGRITNNVMIRDASANETVVAQEAEAVIEMVMGTTDPLSVTIDQVTARQISGMTLLTLARVLLYNQLSSSTVDQFTAGLVSIKQASNDKGIANIKSIIDEANKILGLNVSVILLIEDIEIGGGTVAPISVDQSRLLIDIP